MASGDSLLLVVQLWRDYVLQQICPGEEATNPEDGFGRTTVRPSNVHANAAGRDPIHLRRSGARTACDRDSCDPCIIPIRPGFSNSTTPRSSNILSAAENAAAASSLPADVVKYYLGAGAGLGAADYGPSAPSGSEVFATATTLFASDVFEGMGVSRTWGALRTAWNTSLRESVRRALPGRRLMDKSVSTSDWIAAYRSAGLSRVDSAAAVIIDFFYIFYLSQFPGLPSLPLALSAASVLTIGVRLDNVDMQDDLKFGPGSVYDRAAALPPLPAGSGWLEFCADVAVCGTIIKDRETVWTGFPCQLPEVCLNPAALMDLRWIDGMVGPFYGAALRLLGMDGPAGRIISGVGDCGCARLAMDQLVRYNELTDIIHDQYLDLPLNDVLAATGLSGRFDPSAYQFSCNVVVERISRCPRHDEDTQDLLAGIASGAVVPYTIIPRYNLLVELASHGPPPEPQWYCVPLDDAGEYDCSTFLAEDWSVSNFPTLGSGSGGAARAAALRTSNVASQSAATCSYEAVLDSLGGGCSLETFLGFLASHEGFDDSVARSTLGGFWDLLTARAPRHSDVAAFFLTVQIGPHVPVRLSHGGIQQIAYWPDGYHN